MSDEIASKLLQLKSSSVDCFSVQRFRRCRENLLDDGFIVRTFSNISKLRHNFSLRELPEKIYLSHKSEAFEENLLRDVFQIHLFEIGTFVFVTE